MEQSSGAEFAPEITEKIVEVNTSTSGPTEGDTFQFSDGFTPLIDMDSCNTEFVDSLPQVPVQCTSLYDAFL